MTKIKTSPEKPIHWTLNTLTNVQRLSTEEMMKLNLRKRKIVVASFANQGIGAYKRRQGANNTELRYTRTLFPLSSIDFVVLRVKRKRQEVIFEYKNIYGDLCSFNPSNTNMLFVIEEDDGQKEFLAPQYAWLPDSQIC